jgi:chloramphenicol-sensitive protein RarD
VARLDSLSGLAMETTLLFPFMLGYWLWLMASGKSAMGSDTPYVQVLLPLGGVITAVPLLWFAAAARRLRLATIGFMQYIAPTFQFLLAVAAFGEPFTRAHAISFALIWIALTIYTTDTLRASRNWRTAPSAK